MNGLPNRRQHGRDPDRLRDPDVDSAEVRVYPPERVPIPEKRAHNRHYLQQYFTKRAWNIASYLIEYYTNPGEVVLDPFCGAGVIPVEALALRRHALACDINPWAVFITRMTAFAPVDLPRLESAYRRIADETYPKMDEVRSNPALLRSVLDKSQYPTDSIPAGPFQPGLCTLKDLFTEVQLGQLVLLRNAIQCIASDIDRDLLRLAFSITLDRANKMYSARGRGELRGRSAPFFIKRYQVWDDHTDVSVSLLFRKAFYKLVKAKTDANEALDRYVSPDTLDVWEGSATRIHEHVKPESVDYVLTDPPYGRNYNYLDLSMMWNAWLGFEVTDESRRDEIIQGGSLRKTQDEYRDLLTKAIAQVARVLKPERWATIIYSESNMANWQWLLSTCEEANLRFVATAWSGSPLPTHNKKQSPYGTAAGEYYVHLRKMEQSRFRGIYGNPTPLPRREPGDIVRLAIQKVIVLHLGASIELVSDLVISNQLLGRKFLQTHGLDQPDIRQILEQHFDPNGGRWQVREIAEIDPKIDAYERLRYSLFHKLSKAGDEGMPVEAIREFLPDLVALHGAQLPLNRIQGMLHSFASPGETGKWRLDRGKTECLSQLRLFFEKSTVETLRDFLERQDRRRKPVRKSVQGLADLTARFINKRSSDLAMAIRLALLTEYAAEAVASCLGSAVAAISAVDELASGDVDLSDLRSVPLKLVISLKAGKAISPEQYYQLSERIFGPVLSAHDVWFEPVVLPHSQTSPPYDAKVDLMVS